MKNDPPIRAALLANLNSKQRDAVLFSHSTALLIQAGPGAGKTRTLTARIAHQLTMGVQPDAVIAMTFTNKAAEELQERLVSVLGDGGKGVTAGTFHSVCLRFLRRYPDRVGLRPNFAILDADDAEHYVTESASRFDCQLPRRQLVTAISKAKSLQVPPEYLVGKAAEILSPSHLPMAGQVAVVYGAYQNRLKSDNLVDFDDLLLYGLKLYRDHPETVEHIRHVFVDEFQDTSGLQYALINAMAKDCMLTVVGDSDQSIYGWRQADATNARKLMNDFPGCGFVALDTTYRSTESITNVCKHLIAQDLSRPSPPSFSTVHGRGPLPLLLSFPTDIAEANFVAQEIDRLIRASHGMLKYGDIAVLARRNVQRDPVERALLSLGIPYKVAAGSSVIDKKEAKDMLAFFSLVIGVDGAVERMAMQRCVNLVHHISWKEYERPSGSKRRPPRKSINALITYAGQRKLGLLNAARDAVAKKAISQLVGDLRALLRVVDSAREEFERTKAISPTLAVVSEVLDMDAFIHREHSDKPHEERRRLQVVHDLIDMGGAFDARANEGGDHEIVRRFLDMATMGSGVGRGSGDLVTLATLHSSKGLEWPVVFAIGLEDSEMPSSIHGHSELTPARLAEERRTLYVGLTRAAMILEMTWHRKHGVGASQMSRFLRQIPKDCYIERKHLRLRREDWILFGKLLGRQVPDKVGLDGEYLPEEARRAEEEEISEKPERKELEPEVLIALHGGFVGAKSVKSSNVEVFSARGQKRDRIEDSISRVIPVPSKKSKKGKVSDGQRRITDLFPIFCRNGEKEDEITDDEDDSKKVSSGSKRESPPPLMWSPGKRTSLTFGNTEQDILGAPLPLPDLQIRSPFSFSRIKSQNLSVSENLHSPSAAPNAQNRRNALSYDAAHLGLNVDPSYQAIPSQARSHRSPPRSHTRPSSTPRTPPMKAVYTFSDSQNRPRRLGTRPTLRTLKASENTN
ncbi:P-loop containing nucleoside triphosphate hydrolase protein [Gonapodya prolifera JEL478]|uniref:DNA 3'-5' helicase n=1 Tax=Gonapodya prolifera (strain JEL478) TaxID=1344416 RepID=A0A139AR24_GONPJ|nr:P-loop containing nucleoside triphosphate hydrolase protein [Gonapodya prolifera JEL478]|eukprot:KXS19186.1 P-loop containing nucleoside triphosphate hydrolase protein [Gonapodya prolifera JEL478]